ncbi:4Fe-4S dicluster domain-containing protein [Paradesulfitobacterium ferrireducens]|uniref:4Fe-4S dicluster domain-containing protein n=1 Tax=Paradesulfitobacterium ferrireducens TaxID=2816476 RepID=UPI001A8E2423|nr:4Fe-4S dicluster domain-containing protein [Paradesulfitobacterium ferrireducens]
MYIVAIDEEQCSGCNSCTAGCPARLLKFNGEKAEVAGDESECLGCESCVTVCPTGAVSITEM